MSVDPKEVALLANMAYGESYYKENNYEEMAAIASVLVRQRDARGYRSMQEFVGAEPSYSFVMNDGNKRFHAISRFSEADIAENVAEFDRRVKENDHETDLLKLGDVSSRGVHHAAALQRLEKAKQHLLFERAAFDGFGMAYRAAHNALDGGVDYSNGAYFWDGWDIKTNYADHAKVLRGIKITSPDHNIFGISDNLVTVVKYRVRTTVRRGNRSSVREEVGRYDHVYESTAAKGGTIFWKMSEDYIRVEHAKAYK